MPEKKTLQRAHRAKKEGKSGSTQAGEFVREEVHHARSGKHKVASKKQAVAIGLSKARRAGVKVKPPSARKSSAATRKKARQDSAKGHAKHTSHRSHTSRKRASRSR